MVLYIAEKPSLGRAIADALPKPHKKAEGFITAANGDVVSWCYGHLLELAEPEDYDPVFKKWQAETLPIIPEQWQLKPKPKTRKQISVLRKLCKEADQIVHAGDPDREGQLLVDEVIEYLKLPQYKKSSLKRCLISDLNTQSVKKALSNLRDNRDFIPLSVSALARSRADWLYGINLTRAYTLQGRSAGYNGVLSVGRVQTPVLGLVVRRDSEIESFQSKPLYEVFAQMSTEQGERFKVKWQPSEACEKWQDDAGRVLYRPLAENVAARIHGKQGTVDDISCSNKQIPAPLPYNLSALQIDANKRFSLSAQQVLDACQNLYEKHKLLTYPRSDCRYIPENHHAEAAQVINAVIANEAQFSAVQQAIDPQVKGRAWNDKKVDAHHAIIPTQKKMALSKLPKAEQQVYELVSRQYLAQFMPAYRYAETKLKVVIEGGLFTTSAKQIIDPGWKLIIGKAKGEEEEPLIPKLEKGQPLTCLSAEIKDKQTQPPKPYTDATLLAAMTGISRHVEDPSIRKILKDTDGLGTEATRAGIIELLMKRQFLARDGKIIRSTETGKSLIGVLPDKAGKPDMTAQWESSLDLISKREASYSVFMDEMVMQLRSMVSQSATVDLELLRQMKPVKNTFKRKRTRAKKKAK